MITIAERKKLAKLVLTTDDNALIEKIKSIIFPLTKAYQTDVKKYNKEIDAAIKEIKGGTYFTQDEADLLLAEWEKK
jgi:hypothetical protein